MVDMIKLTYEQEEENRGPRHQIIDDIMEIQDTKSLGSVRLIARINKEKEWGRHVLTLEDAVGMVDMEAVCKLYWMFAGDEGNRAVGEQVTELCRDAMEQHGQAGGFPQAGHGAHGAWAQNKQPFGMAGIAGRRGRHALRPRSVKFSVKILNSAEPQKITSLCKRLKIAVCGVP